MTDTLMFLTGLALLLGIFYRWAFHHLPYERYQFVGSIPLRKQADGHWHGLNLTYYGLFNACAVTFAAMIVLILLASAAMSAKTILLIVVTIVGIFAPCAKIIARLVEKKSFTFSIGGASFVGLILMPFCLMGLGWVLVNFGHSPLPIMTIMAAVSVGYAFGEGIGRLACLSFGCCYGKPLSHLPATWQTVLAPLSMTYEGHTKKAAYADNLAGQRVLAVPALTTALYTTAGLCGTYLFLAGKATAAYLTCVLVTQIWRVLSEFLRADYRGGGRISDYQFMAGIAAIAAVIYAVGFRSPSPPPDLSAGLHILWNPMILLTGQFLWFGTFLYTGRSQVTGSRIQFFVHSDRI